MGQWEDRTKDSGLEAAVGGQRGLGHRNAEEELAERNKKRYSGKRARGHRTELRQFQDFSANPVSSLRFLSETIDVTRALQKMLPWTHSPFPWPLFGHSRRISGFMYALQNKALSFYYSCSQNIRRRYWVNANYYGTCMPI